MTDSYPAGVQRRALLQLAEALHSASTALRRDECGDWRIKGTKGWIYAIPGSLARPGVGGFQLVCLPHGEFGDPPYRSRVWTFTKADLSFCELQNDGDHEGTMLLFRLPTVDEAKVIRSRLGIRKRPDYDEETLARYSAAIAGNRSFNREKPAWEENSDEG